MVLWELNDDLFPRVMKPMEKGAAHPRVQTDVESDGLIVVLTSRSKFAKFTSPALNTRAHSGPTTINHKSINGAMEKTKCNVSRARF